MELMDELGLQTFAVVGHDRVARVGYRLALDDPERVERYASLTVVPTPEVWRAFGSLANFHWTFLAQPEGLPECLLAPIPMPFSTRPWPLTTRRFVTRPCAGRSAKTTGPEPKRTSAPILPTKRGGIFCCARCWCSGLSSKGANLPWPSGVGGRSTCVGALCPVGICNRRSHHRKYWPPYDPFSKVSAERLSLFRGGCTEHKWVAPSQGLLSVSELLRNSENTRTGVSQ